MSYAVQSHGRQGRALQGKAYFFLGTGQGHAAGDAQCPARKRHGGFRCASDTAWLEGDA